MSKASSTQLPPLEQKEFKDKKKDKKMRKKKRDKHRERKEERKERRSKDKNKDRGEFRRSSRRSSRASSSDTDMDVDVNFETLNVDDLSDDSQDTLGEIKVRDHRSKKKDKHGKHKHKRSSRGSRDRDRDREDGRRDKDNRKSNIITALPFLGDGINNMSQLVSVLEDMEFVDENPMYGDNNGQNQSQMDSRMMQSAAG